MLGRASEQIDASRPFVLYRKPDQPEIFGIFQADDRLHTGSDFSQSGFIFAPFDRHPLPVLIRPDQIIRAESPAGPDRPELFDVKEHISTGKGKKAGHIRLIRLAQKSIRNGILRKVVLSCSTEVKSKCHPLTVFPTLLAINTGAFCYLWHHPHIGTWLGASPELLLEMFGDRLKTMALAGTQPLREGILPQWNNKEQEEQEMVTTYLKDRLYPVCDDLEVDETVSIRAADVWHLRNIILAKSGNNSLDVIISALHPTPAVCGLPVSAASDFIISNETYDRQFYTGYLGELNLWEQPGCSLYVNLRCMQYQNQRYLLYAGGGITSGSIPENEWLEIKAKWNTMWRVLYNSPQGLGQ